MSASCVDPYCSICPRQKVEYTIYTTPQYTQPANQWLMNIAAEHLNKQILNKPLQELLGLISNMNEHELGFILFMVQRVAQGRKTYGPLNPYDGRDYKKDSVEERFDDAFYSWCDWKATRGEKSNTG